MIVIQPFMKRTRVCLENLWSIGSVAYVIGLVTLCGYWAIDLSGTKRIETHTYLSVRQGDTLEIVSDVVVVTDSPQTAYTLRLVNESGEVLHVWPTVKTDSEVRFKHPVYIPLTTPQGEYKVVADIQYLHNPITTRTVEAELARLVVN